MNIMLKEEFIVDGNAVTISPCPGLFRKREEKTAEEYKQDRAKGEGLTIDLIHKIKFKCE